MRKDPFNRPIEGGWGTCTMEGEIRDWERGWLKRVKHYLVHGQPCVILTMNSGLVASRLIEYLAKIPRGSLDRSGENQRDLTKAELAAVGKVIQVLMGSLIFVEDPHYFYGFCENNDPT